MKIENDIELMAMFRVIVSAKFGCGKDEPEIAHSQIIANLSAEIFKEIVEALEISGKFDQAQHWKEIIQMDREWYGYGVTIERIKDLDTWSNLSVLEKHTCVKTLCAPYLLSDEFLDELISIGDKHWLI